MDLGEPSALANIPRSPLENGRAQLAPVFGLTEGRKRKRQELCAAVDGDSINLYEIHQGRILSSYPIPPDSVLECLPHSVRIKAEAGKTTRCTYCATTRRGDLDLVLFQDNVIGNDRQTITKSVSLDNSNARVVRLDVLPQAHTHQVLVVRDDGQYEIYNGDLSSRLSFGKLEGLSSQDRLTFVQWFTPSQALRSMLKARPDIVAMSDPHASFVLGITTLLPEPGPGTENPTLQLSVWQLSGALQRLTAASSPQPLLKHTFPTTSPLVPQGREPILLTSKDTRLVVRTLTRTYTFDLTSTTFRTIQDMAGGESDHSSTIFISDALAVSSTPTNLQLFNTQFRTVQTKLDLSRTGQKRKRGSSGKGLICFSGAYFPALTRIIALRRDQLVAIDLQITRGDDFADASRQSSLLISNIGRGAAAQDRLKASDKASESMVGQVAKQNEAIEQWHSAAKILEQSIQDEDYATFEKTYLEQVAERSSRAPKESQILINHKVDYVLAKILEYKAASDASATSTLPKTKLAFPAPKIVELLATKGLLTLERINRVLKSSAKSSFEPITSGDITQLLVGVSPGLNLLLRWLQEAPHIANDELCATILLLLRRALTESQSSSTLTAEDTRPTDLAVANSNDASSRQSVTKGAIARNVTTCLCAAIERLAETGQNCLSNVMRESFDQEEIIALVQFLRQRLFSSGYTRSLRAQIYPSSPDSENESSAVEHASQHQKSGMSLATIVTTLSCCIDAIGPVGVLSFGDEDVFLQKLIPDLSSEISRATEAVQESAFLEGLLRETLRFVESVPRTQGQEVDNHDGSHAQQTKPGSITTLYSEPAIEEGSDPTAGLLPLSLRSEGKISRTKVRKGNGMVYERSEREMGMYQDRLRGPYALERLVL